jgi:ribonuclease HI
MFDGTIFYQLVGYGIGICIRDEKGEFVKAKSPWKETCIPPQEAEAIGLYKALLWLRALGIQHVTIELDCKSVVDGVVGNITSVAEHGTIIRKCKTLLNCLQNFKVNFIWRQANLVAHTLARESSLYASSTIFLF